MCKYEAATQYSQKIHIQTQHCVSFKFSCNECSFQTPYSITLKNHARLNHADVNDEKETSKVTPENNVKKTKQSMSAWKSIGNNHTTKDEVTKNQAV